MNVKEENAIFVGAWFYRRSISSGHRPIGTELERMVTMGGLLMEV
jgi:hypothetical protein